MKRLVLVYAIFALFMTSCQERNKHGKRVDTPTTGKITIVADESLKPIVEAEVETFNALHKDAQISVIYLPVYTVVSRISQVVTQVGGNMVLSGIPHLSLLPSRTLLMFEGGVTIRVDGDNGVGPVVGMRALRALASRGNVGL